MRVWLAALLLLGSLVDQGLVDVRDDTTASNGRLQSQNIIERCNSLGTCLLEARHQET